MMSTDIQSPPLFEKKAERRKPTAPAAATKAAAEKQSSIANAKKSASNSAAKEPAVIQATRNLPTETELHQMQYDTSKFGGFRAECVNQDFLYRVCYVANDLLESATILVRESGMTIQTTDAQSVAVILVDMPAKMFSSYRCEGFVTAHICMETLVNMIKKIGSDHARCKLTLEIRPDDTETMIVKIYDSKKKITTTHVVKLWEPKNIMIYFDQGQFENYRVVSSRGWHEEINNLSHLVDPNKPIRISAGNDLKLSIEDEYGDSSTVFEQNKTPGYKVVQKSVDICAKDDEGNYSFFNEIEGLATASEALPASKKVKKNEPKKPKTKPINKRRRKANDDDEDDEDDAADQDYEQQHEDSQDDYLSIAQLTKFAKPVIEDDEEDATLLDKPAEKIHEVQLTVSLLLLKMISKGLRLNPELFLLIKKNYPMMFVQRIETHGRFLIALSPKVLENDEPNSSEPNAMDSLMALQSEE